MYEQQTNHKHCCEHTHIYCDIIMCAGREVDRLVASTVLDLSAQGLLQRLDAGEQLVLPLVLQEAPECRLQQMPEGLGSQVG